MPTAGPKWLQEPMRVLDLVYNQRMADYPMSDVIRVCKRLKANVIHFHCQFNMGGGCDEHGMFFNTRLAKKQNRDVLGEFLPLARKARIRTIVYLNLHWFTRAFAAEHPDWRVVMPDDAPMEGLYGDDDATFCINTPWRDWSFTLIEDTCAYPVDGVFFDGPVYFLRRGACHCAHCRRLFQERFGRELPAPDPADRELPAPDPADREVSALRREFAVSSMVRYYRDAVAVVRRSRPGAVAYANYANVAEPSSAAGRANRRLVPEMDALLAEGGFMYGRVGKSVFKTGASSRLYETQAAGKASINAVSMAFSPWRWVSLSEPETRVLLAEAASCVNPYYAIFIQGIEAAGIDAAADVYGFLARNAKYYRKTVSGARVAVLQSAQTLDTYAGVDIPWTDLGYQQERRAEAVGNYSRAFYGFYEMLLRARIPFDIIDEARLTEGDLDRYRALLMPNAACLSDTQCGAVRDFVRAGGRAVADFETSHYDASGRRRNDFGLADLFGVTSGNRVSDYRRWDYVYTVDTEAPHLSWMPTGFFPAPRHNLAVTPTDGQVQAVFSRPLPSNIVSSGERSDEPFLVARPFGSGVCYYLPATFGEFYEASQPQVYPRMLGEMLGPDASPVSLHGAPNLLDVHVRRQPRPGRTMLHLVNLELGPIERIVPTGRMSVSIQVDHAVSSVRALRSAKSLKFSHKSGQIRFAVPPISEFEVVALEK